MLTCIHSTAGLCPACQADYDEDPAAWLEFGDHPEGIARWKAEQERIDRNAADQPTMPLRDHSVGLTTGTCVRCGEATHRIQSHPHLKCKPPAIPL